MEKKRKRQRFPTIGSDVEKKRVLKLYQDSYEGVKLKLKVISDNLKKGKDIDAESTRFLKNSGNIISALENKIKSLQTEDKEETAVQMPEAYYEMVNRLHVQAELYKKEYGIQLNNQLIKDFYEDNGYIRCPYCHELHPENSCCPWLELAKKHGIEVNDNLTKILNAVDQEEEIVD